jgi:hypothetical protein
MILPIDLEYFKSNKKVKTNDDKTTKILIKIQKLVIESNELINKRDEILMNKYFQRMINNL